MPRRDVVLTGLIAFGAGVAVGVNWKKLGKEAAPLLEKLGLKMSDLADFLATVTDERVTRAKPKSARSPSRKSAAESKGPSPLAARRNGNHAPSVSSAKRNTSRSKPVVLSETTPP